MKALIAILLIVVSMAPSAYGFTQPFSAEAIQSAPGMQPTRMKLYISANKAVRIEMTTPKGEIIQQFFPGTGLMRVLYPDTREYLEQQSPTPLSMPGGVVTNPCENMPDATCEKVGEEEVNGQPAIHWRMTRPGNNGQELIIEQWLEKKRGITLKELLPGGVTIIAQMVGTEKMNGRQAERWEVVMTTTDGQSQSGTRWYDDALGITIREEFPNGSVRELKNIIVQEPDANLFELPAGYRQLTMPAQPQRR